MLSELEIDAANDQAVVEIVLRPGASTSKHFIKLFLLDNDQRISELSAGAVRPDLDIRIIRRAKIPMPPVDEQHEIVRRVEALFALADRVEERVAAAGARADRLTQAILKKAFRGELVVEEVREDAAVAVRGGCPGARCE